MEADICKTNIFIVMHAFNLTVICSSIKLLMSGKEPTIFKHLNQITTIIFKCGLSKRLNNLKSIATLVEK